MRDGILVLNKPQNWTSSDCVAVCRRALKCKGIKKVGHGGTLDPMATGVLPIFVGQATRIMEYLDLDTKTYRCSAALGTVTDTLDIWGEVLETLDFSHVTEADITEGLKSFEGWVQQIPPKYSAVRINGKRLYEYAYKGLDVDVDIKPRTVNVPKIQLISLDLAEGKLVFDVTCSKGTYIRAICSDLGEKLGCGCVMTGLERTSVGNIGLYDGFDVISPEDIKARYDEGDAFANELYDRMLVADYPLTHFGEVELSADRTSFFSRGGHIRWKQVKVLSEPDASYLAGVRNDGSMPLNARGRRCDRLYKVYCKDEFIGIGYYDAENQQMKADKVFIEKR